ncbi:hypothetical protein PAPHI01_1668 [Pancytospora philotis]|nr:hypothetical protein PAPHI01_1668 [Pancytospora philotis]
MEHIEDEIEFFGFLPVTFTTDLQEALEDTLEEILQRNSVVSTRVRSGLLSALRKNLFIFNNFVLRNILKFPPGFKMERKISDVEIRGDAGALIEAIRALQSQTLRLREERRALHGRLGALVSRNNGYRSLLANQQKHLETAEAVREVRKYLKEMTGIYEQFKISACTKENDFDSLMEYKDIKNDYYRDERDKQLGIADFEALEYLVGKTAESQ